FGPSCCVTHQCMKSKFMDILEDVLTSQRTSPVVRSRLLDVLAAAGYASSATASKNDSSFRVLRRKVKPSGKHDEVSLYEHGSSFQFRISAFSPTPTPGYQTPVHPQVLQAQFSARAMPPQPQSQRPQPQAQTRALPQPTRARRNVPNQGQLQRIVPPEEDMQRVFQECRFPNGNAQMRANRADRSLTTREAQLQHRTIKQHNSLNGLNVSSLLGALVEANEALTSVLRMHDDIERRGISRQAMGCNRQEVRLDRSKNVVDECGYVHRVNVPPSMPGSSSGSPSTSPSPSPHSLQLSIPASLWPHTR
ncbi:hypothetical protein BJV78DRAFT_1176372, partial [Lactifluus subvellereus]